MPDNARGWKSGRKRRNAQVTDAIADGGPPAVSWITRMRVIAPTPPRGSPRARSRTISRRPGFRATPGRETGSGPVRAPLPVGNARTGQSTGSSGVSLVPSDFACCSALARSIAIDSSRGSGVRKLPGSGWPAEPSLFMRLGTGAPWYSSGFG